MPLNKLPYKRLQHLIGLHLSTSEYPATQKVIDELSIVLERGYLTKADLVKVCRWKSPRAIKHIQRNNADTVKKVTNAAFATHSEKKRLELLTSLYGVSVPMASSILMLTNPQCYGVIDIRVWQLLFEMGSVRTNSDGIGFNFRQWRRYLTILRYYADKYNVSARDIERIFFRVHVLHQKGKLYND